jgi:phage tail sheath protein FI
LRQANASTIDEYARRGVNLIGRDPANAQRLVLASAITTSIDETWRAIGVRRLFNYVERSLRAVLAWAPTAPMAEATWAQAREEVESFLMRLWRAGMLAGNSPEEAFFVRCDPSTMTQDDILNGRLILAIGVNAKDRSLQFPQPPVLQIPLQRIAAPLQ